MYIDARFKSPAAAARDILRNAHELFPRDSSPIGDGPFYVMRQSDTFRLIPFGSDADYRHAYYVDWDSYIDSWIFHVALK